MESKVEISIWTVESEAMWVRLGWEAHLRMRFRWDKSQNGFEFSSLRYLPYAMFSWEMLLEVEDRGIWFSAKVVLSLQGWYKAAYNFSTSEVQV